MSGGSVGPATAHERAAARGAVAAAICYLTWGLVPLYWHQLAAIDALELIAHRLVWSLVFLVIVLLVRRGLAEIKTALNTSRAVAVNLLSSTLLTANWLVYVWGINHGHVIECSLGYFLVPLINVALGRLVLHEKLRTLQWAAIACAAAGVVFQLVQLGRLPWIALALAVTFGLYGLLRKQSPLGPLTGLAVETALLAPLAAFYLLWLHHVGEGALGHVDQPTEILVLSAGVITAVPLLLFAYGARRIQLSTLGLLQYIAPTVQFTLGVWVYHEPFSRDRALSFIFIWLGLALYTLDGVRTRRAKNQAAAATTARGEINRDAPA